MATRKFTILGIDLVFIATILYLLGYAESFLKYRTDIIVYKEKVTFIRPILEDLRRVEFTLDTKANEIKIWDSGTYFFSDYLKDSLIVTYGVECGCFTAIHNLDGWSFFASDAKSSTWHFLPRDGKAIPTDADLQEYMRKALKLWNMVHNRFKAEIDELEGVAKTLVVTPTPPG